MIQLYHVHKRYPNGCDALTDVTLRVREGEFVFLTGPSGAGKSTLLRLLLVMERATDGQILIGGRNIHVLRDASVPYLRRNIGVVFQDFRLIPRRTVFENVAIALEIMGLKRREIDRRVTQLLEGLRLIHKAQAFPGDLSGGEQQRVAIARALVNEPAILLADEPTGNLDPELGHEIMQLLTDINRRGTTVVVATHDTALIERYGLRTLALGRGHLVEDRPRTGRATFGEARERSHAVGSSPLAVARELDLEGMEKPLPIIDLDEANETDDAAGERGER
jgi:cell division transport system ATP-binding protein